VNAFETDPVVAAKVKAHLESKWKRSCDCGGTGWALDIFVVLGLSTQPHLSPPINPSALPCAAVCCTNCGLTKLLNLKTAGIVP